MSLRDERPWEHGIPWTQSYFNALISFKSAAVGDLQVMPNPGLNQIVVKASRLVRTRLDPFGWNTVNRVETYAC